MFIHMLVFLFLHIVFGHSFLTIDNDQYDGCHWYEFLEDRILDRTILTDDQTIESCISYCLKGSHTYAGMHAASCYCTNDVFGGDSSHCYSEEAIRCRGNPYQVCGGLSGFTYVSVYKTCPIGRRGKKCEDSCPDSCSKNKACHHDGECLRECMPGYEGRECAEQCTENKYGTNCDERCTLCRDKVCDHENYGQC